MSRAGEYYSDDGALFDGTIELRAWCGIKDFLRESSRFMPVVEPAVVWSLVFILSVFIWDLQWKSHFNRKMVFRVTKSQSMKDKLSFI